MSCQFSELCCSEKFYEQYAAFVLSLRIFGGINRSSERSFRIQPFPSFILPKPINHFFLVPQSVLRTVDSIGSWKCHKYGHFSIPRDICTLIDLDEVLAPSDEAFAKYLNLTNVAGSESGGLEAIFTYHVLKGTHPKLLLQSPSQFIPTLLSNTGFSNVTGGQRVEAKSSNNGIIFYSALKTIAKIVTPVRCLPSTSILPRFALAPNITSGYPIY
jgi:hypothetical protein